MFYFKVYSFIDIRLIYTYRDFEKGKPDCKQ